jgi:hypothetical protein
MIAAFGFPRGCDFYGNPRPSSVQGDGERTALSGISFQDHRAQGSSLAGTYVAWLVILAALYPPADGMPASSNGGTIIG